MNEIHQRERAFLPYGRQAISADDVQAVCDVLSSDFLTCGPQIEAFEDDFRRVVGSKHAIAVSSATAALHLAMMAARINAGDRVVTSPNTFLASANCAAYVGATPDFCDIDPVSYNLDPRRLEADWQEDTKAVVAVAYAGQAPDMPEIARIAKGRRAIVVEDASHGTGGGFFHQGREWKMGGHPWADMSVFSFHPVKTMTSGEGGMLVTDDDELARRARLLRSHGMERDPARFVGFGGNDEDAQGGPWVYEMQELGYNYRITDIQCALGRSQLKQLPKFVSRRREIVEIYRQRLNGLPWLTVPGLKSEEDREFISWHLFTVQIDFEQIGKSRVEVMQELREKGIGSQVLYIPVHLQPWYQRSFGYGYGKCPVAESCYERFLSLPLFPGLSDGDVESVVQALLEVA